MEDSILLTIKEMLGLSKTYPAFSTDVIRNINGSLFILMQNGIGPSTGFRITGESEKWSDLILERKDLDAVVNYIYIKARLVFDPPTSSAVLQMLKEEAAEYLYRLNTQVEFGPYKKPADSHIMTEDEIDEMMKT